MAEFDMRRFVEDRDSAFTSAVLRDDWEAVRKYMRKYGIFDNITTTDKAFKGGVYKAVQECGSIPDNVKQIAAQKCRELGMRPTIG